MTKPSDDVTRFHSVDSAANPRFFTGFMEKSHAMRAAKNYKDLMLEQLAIREGAAILDVGCGAGQDVQELARAVGPNGRVVGVDTSETMLQEARARSTQAQVHAEYVLADATHLPFADSSFDGCRAARVFEHLSQPELALAEMVRVARPGARIVVADPDFDLTVVDIPDRALARKVIHLVCDQMEQGWMGRQLPGLFRQAGLSDIWFDGRMMPLDRAFFQMAYGGIVRRAESAGAISTEEVAEFWNALETAEREQRFFAGVVGFIASGRKPVAGE